MGIKRTTSFRQEWLNSEKVNRYADLKGKQFTLTRMFELLLEPVIRAAEGKGPDPFPHEGDPLPPPEELCPPDTLSP